MFYYLEKKQKQYGTGALIQYLINKQSFYQFLSLVLKIDILVIIEWPHPPFILNKSNIQLPNINKSLKGHKVKDMTMTIC